jgi:hypothetical protein
MEFRKSSESVGAQAFSQVCVRKLEMVIGLRFRVIDVCPPAM